MKGDKRIETIHVILRNIICLGIYFSKKKQIARLLFTVVECKVFNRKASLNSIKDKVIILITWEIYAIHEILKKSNCWILRDFLQPFILMYFGS